MDTTHGSPRAASRRVANRVELRCLLCGRAIGSLEAEHWVCFGPVLFRPPGVDLPVHVTDWRRLRCVSCGGNAYPDEETVVRVYPPLRWDDDDPPRRGRPPKWLVEARKTQSAGGE